ncbi:hypothetical protein [Argonema antarcticum]|uniref:hypothetical protein n=1 Tax=Argonema antarcticum TaxID=2942763 RepID=UPI0020129E0D|nr:hypothetical protein [Argonema antarcticum]MCL1474793.1 hypothetical protein [Argonema antarcticum A004/B2]
MKTCTKFPHLQILGWSLLTAAIAAGTYPITTLAQSSSGYRIVNRDVAANGAIDVKVYPGRASAIDFSQTDEVVSYVMIADPSRLVFGTDTELSDGGAKTVFLRSILPLRFPGATTAKITSLSIKTLDSRGRQRLYTFNVVPTNNRQDQLGIRIATVQQSGNPPSLDISTGWSIRTSEVERGLSIAIQRRYTTANDPVVYQVQQFLDKLRNQNLSPIDAARKVGLDFSVIIELVKIAKEEPPISLTPIPVQATRG